MELTASGIFTVADWDEQTTIELPGDAKVTRASIVQEFEGDLEATGSAVLLMHYADASTADIVGYQRFEGTLGGRQGGFLVRSEGGYDGAAATTRLTVVPGSGTGALVGLTGEGAAVAEHEPPGRYELSLSLPG